MIDAEYYVLTIVCALITLFLSLNSKTLSARLNLVDVPVGRKQHKSPTPLMGGVSILIAFVPVALAYTLLNVPERWIGSFLIWIACVTVMAFVGLADDRHSLSPRLRLLTSFLVFALAAALDPTFNVRVLDFMTPKFSIGLGTWWLAIIFTVICCVGLINAVNMADGKNGLVLGLALGWLGILAIRAGGPLLPLTGLLASCLAVLLVFNMQGRLFLGDGGAYAIATSLGLLSIMIYNSPGTNSLRAISADELVLLFIVPITDSFRLTYTRLKQGRSPMSADRDHFHHHLQEKFGWPKGLFVYWILSFLPGVTLILIREISNLNVN